MPDDVLERVRALERAVSDRDDPPEPIPERADLAMTIETLDDRVSDLESILADVSARQSAVEAYLDQIAHVNESVERRADAALAAVDRLESLDGTHDATGSRRGADTHIADAAGQPSNPDHQNGPRDSDAAHDVSEPDSGPEPSQSDGPVARLLTGLLGR